MADNTGDKEKQNYWDKQPGYNGAAFSANGFDDKAGLDEEELLTKDPNWLKASKAVYEMAEGKKWPEDASNQELANWGADYMGYFNANLVSLGKAKYHSSNGTLEQKQGLLYLMQAYDAKDMSWDGMWRGVKGLATDPTTYVGLFSFGTLAAGAQATKFAAKAFITRMLTSSIQSGIQKQTSKFVFKDATQVVTAKVAEKTYTKAALTTAGGLSAVYGGLNNDARQTIKINAGQQAEYSYSELGWSTAISTALGVTTGGVFIVGGRVISNKLFPIANNIPQPNKAILESLGKAPDAKPFLDSAGNLTEGWWRNKATADTVLKASDRFLRIQRATASPGSSKKLLTSAKDMPFVQATAKLAADKALKNPNYTGNAIGPEVRHIVDKSVMASFKSIAIKDATKAPMFSTAGLAQNIKDIPSHISLAGMKKNAAYVLGAKESNILSRTTNGKPYERVSIKWRAPGEKTALGQMMRSGLRLGSGGTLDTGGKFGLQTTLLGKVGGVGAVAYGLGTISGSDTLSYLGGNALDLSTDLSPVKYYFSSDDEPVPAVKSEVTADQAVKLASDAFAAAKVKTPAELTAFIAKQPAPVQELWKKEQETYNARDPKSIAAKDLTGLQVHLHAVATANSQQPDKPKNEIKDKKDTPKKQNPTTPKSTVIVAKDLESAQKNAQKVLDNASQTLKSQETQLKTLLEDSKYLRKNVTEKLSQDKALAISAAASASLVQIEGLKVQAKSLGANIKQADTLAGINILLAGKFSDFTDKMHASNTSIQAQLRDSEIVSKTANAMREASSQESLDAAKKHFYDFFDNSVVVRTATSAANDGDSDAAKIMRNTGNVLLGGTYAAWDWTKDSFNFMNQKDSLGGWGPIIMQLGAGFMAALALKKTLMNPIFENTLGRIPIIGGFLSGTASFITSVGGGLALGGALMGAYQNSANAVEQSTEKARKHSLKGLDGDKTKTTLVQDAVTGKTKKVISANSQAQNFVQDTVKTVESSAKSADSARIQGNPAAYMPSILAMQQSGIIVGKRDDITPKELRQSPIAGGTFSFVPNSTELRADDVTTLQFNAMMNAPDNTYEPGLSH